MNYHNLYLRCLEEEEAKQILEEFHLKEGRTGHAPGNALAYQILRAKYYWPYLFRDTHQYAKTCHNCQMAAGREKFSSMPLQPMLESKPFAKWGLNFVGVINPNSSMRHQFILTAIDYCMRWTEAIATKRATSEVVIHFLEESILTRFGTPFSLVCDNVSGFSSKKLSDWASSHNIKITFSTNYYPQGNGLAKSTNNNLLTVLKKLLERKPRDWHSKLKYALWADRIRIKNALGMSLFQLVYGTKHVFLAQFKIGTLQFIKDFVETHDALEARLMQLAQLEEKREQAFQNLV